MARTLAELKELIDSQDFLAVEQLQEVITTVRALAEQGGVVVGDPCKANPAELAVAQTTKRRYEYKYVAASHLKLIAEEIRAFTDGERAGYRGLLVDLPPRHGKSETLSIWTPLWLLKRNPKTRIILASYGAEKAIEWGRKVRDFILANPDFGINLNPGVLAASGWTTVQGGGMWTAGVGGPISGRGADVLIVDDPYKDAAEAYSQTIREKIRAWFNSVALTRLEPAGFIVVVHTRWHEMDLISELDRTSVDGTGIQVKHISFPALAVEKDVLGREPGDALWPERFSVARLEEIKKGMSPYEWGALYQQNPTPEEGASVKRVWWKYYSAHDAEKHYEQADQVILAFDLALKETESGSYNVGMVMARKGSITRILDFWRERCDFPTAIAKARSWSIRYTRATAKIVEDKASGPALIATLCREIPGFVPMPAQGSKLIRLNAVIPLIHAGNVELPHPDQVAWTRDVIEECAAFPNGQNDDIVDTVSHGLRYLYPQVWQHLDRLAREGAESDRDAEEWSLLADRQKAFSKHIRELKEQGAKQVNGDALMWSDARRNLC